MMPKYSEGYYNLAVSYELLGQIPQALENYKKALSLNPDLWQAKKKIDEIGSKIAY